MKSPNKILSLMLTLVVAFSLVILTAHSYSHQNTELTSCQLCIQHGNSGHAITPSENTPSVFHSDTPFQATLKIVSAVFSAHYRLPVRAPPSIIS
jgi:hypothetical protein